nr:sensory neuron membrane protein 2 [Matsumurasca onukii]
MSMLSVFWREYLQKWHLKYGKLAILLSIVVLFLTLILYLVIVPIVEEAVITRSTEKIPLEYKKNSITYLTRTIYKAREDLTSPNSLDDKVVTLNAGLYVTAKLVHSIGPSLVSLLNSAAQVIFPNSSTIFASNKVRDFLFDGITLHCSEAARTTASMICNALPSHAPPNIRQKENSKDFLYSFFAHKNYTLQGPYEVDRGLKDVRRAGLLLSKHGTNQLNVWQPGSQCDKLHGTDALTFAPFISKSDLINVYISDVCQVLTLRFDEETKSKGISVQKFSVTSSWLENDQLVSENSCYCDSSNPIFCNESGLRDVSNCMKVPVVISYPHFYHADEKFRTYASGMIPDSGSHNSEIFIHPQSGIPVIAAKRVQFNIPITRIKGFHMTENLTEGLFPLLWISEEIELTDDVLAKFKLPLLIQAMINTTCLVLMSVCLVIIVYLLIALLCFSTPQVGAEDKAPPERRPPPPTLVLANSLYPH